MEVFHNFHASSKFEKTLNATFINLIPKKFRAIDFTDFYNLLVLCMKSIRLLQKFLPTS